MSSYKKRLAVGFAVLAMGAIGLASANPASASRGSNNTGAHVALHVSAPTHFGAVHPNAFTVITNPTAGYVGNTCRYSTDAVADFTDFQNLVQCGGKLHFSALVEARSVPNSWASWGSPPQTETATPHVIYSLGQTSLTLKIPGTRMAGFELEPDLFQIESFTVTFLGKGGANLGSITRDVNGQSGALLFAAKSSSKITQMVITNTAGDDFSVANVRRKV